MIVPTVRLDGHGENTSRNRRKAQCADCTDVAYRIHVAGKEQSSRNHRALAGHDIEWLDCRSVVEHRSLEKRNEFKGVCPVDGSAKYHSTEIIRCACVHWWITRVTWSSIRSSNCQSDVLCRISFYRKLDGDLCSCWLSSSLKRRQILDRIGSVIPRHVERDRNFEGVYHSESSRCFSQTLILLVPLLEQETCSVYLSAISTRVSRRKLLSFFFFFFFLFVVFLSKTLVTMRRERSLITAAKMRLRSKGTKRRKRGNSCAIEIHDTVDEGVTSRAKTIESTKGHSR